MEEGKTEVLVAMSGGVDSSLAAYLLVEDGYRVRGVTFRTECYAESGEWGEASAARRKIPCCSLDSVEDARRVCRRLGIEHLVVDAAMDFTRLVVAPFCEEYLRGRTPNPCVRCNQHIKYGTLLRLAKSLSVSYLATGHYARVRHGVSGERNRLFRGMDRRKDQSYVLWSLSQEALGMALFPLGGKSKREVRSEAAGRGLGVADKEASQEICFVPGDYRDYLRRRFAGEGSALPGLSPGPILDENGTVVGKHRGLVGYTLGQRRGLPALGGEPRYVTAIVPERNELHMGRGIHLGRTHLLVRELNLVGLADWPETVQVRVQLRSRHRAAPARLQRVDKDSVEIMFDEPQRAPTPGQSAVIFRDDEVLGGGVIDSVSDDD